MLSARYMGIGLALLTLALFPHRSAAQSSGAPTPPSMRSAYGDKLKLPGLPNGGHVNDNLYRGAQPHPEGLRELKKLGVTTIVDLRGENPQLRDTER